MDDKTIKLLGAIHDMTCMSNGNMYVADHISGRIRLLKVYEDRAEFVGYYDTRADIKKAIMIDQCDDWE